MIANLTRASLLDLQVEPNIDLWIWRPRTTVEDLDLRLDVDSVVEASILLRRLLGDDSRHRVTGDHLVLLEDAGDLVEGCFVGSDQLERCLFGLVEESPDLGVDQIFDVGAQTSGRRLVAQIAGAGWTRVAHRPEGLGHPKLGNHAPGKVGRSLEIVRGAGRGLLEDQNLGRAAAKHDRQSLLERRLAQ